MQPETPALDALKQRLPDWARDLKINLGVIGSSTALAPAQAWTIALACAHAAREPSLVEAIEADAPLEPAPRAAARGAAAIMAMNNVYYRFVHFTGDAYAQLPPRLRMQLIGKPGIDKLDFELACLAVSAINGCESCVRAHDKTSRDRGATAEMVQDAVRIAAAIQGAATATASADGRAESRTR